MKVRFSNPCKVNHFQCDMLEFINFRFENNFVIHGPQNVHIPVYSVWNGNGELQAMMDAVNKNVSIIMHLTSDPNPMYIPEVWIPITVVAELLSLVRKNKPHPRRMKGFNNHDKNFISINNYI